MWNPWKHVRLAGAVVIIVGALTNTIALVFLGLGLQYIGVVAAVDRLERIIDMLIEKEDKDNAIH